LKWLIVPLQMSIGLKSQMMKKLFNHKLKKPNLKKIRLKRSNRNKNKNKNKIMNKRNSQKSHIKSIISQNGLDSRSCKRNRLNKFKKSNKLH